MAGGGAIGECVGVAAIVVVRWFAGIVVAVEEVKGTAAGGICGCWWLSSGV